MKDIVVNPGELKHLSLLNTMSTGFFSAASAIAFFVLGLVVNALMQESLSPKAKGGLEIAIPVGILLTVGFAICGIVSWCARGSETKELLDQAIILEQEAPSPVTPPQSTPSTAATQP